MLPRRVQVLQIDLGNLLAAGGARASSGAQVGCGGEHLLVDGPRGHEVAVQVGVLLVDVALVIENGISVVVVDGLKVLLRNLGVALRAIYGESVVRLLALRRGLISVSINLLYLHDLEAVAVILKYFKAAAAGLDVLADEQAILLHRLPVVSVACRVFELVIVGLIVVVERAQLAIIIL